MTYSVSVLRAQRTEAGWLLAQQDSLELPKSQQVTGGGDA